MEPGTPANATGYGRACQACFKAKCRCVQRANGSGCERCVRLKRECQASDSIRKRSAKSVLARTAQLENKLDGLVSLLQTVADQNQTQPSGVSLQAATSTSASTSSDFASPPAPVLLPTSHGPDRYHAQDTSSSSAITTLSSHTGSNHLDSLLNPSPDQAEAALTLFRTQMLCYFPILDLPARLSASSLRTSRPFLFLCILAITNRCTPHRILLGRHIKATLGHLFLSENTTSLDLLQGVLCYTAWAHDHFVLKTPSLSRLTHLSMSLVYDMYLNKPRPTVEHELPKMADTEHMKAPTSWFAERTLEQRRAVLGCFLLSSATALKFTQIDPLLWTPYMDECVQILSSNTDSPSDRSLAIQCRLQRIAQKASLIQWPTSPLPTNPSTQIPPSVYITALVAELDSIQTGLTPDLQTDPLITAAIHFTTLTIHEPALNKRIPSSFSLLSTSPGLNRFSSLYTCLTSAQAWLDVFFQRMPPTIFADFTFKEYAQLVTVIFALLRLSTLEDEGWERGMVRRTVDLLQVLDRIVRNLEDLSGMLGEGGEDMVVQCARMFRAIRNGCAVELGAENDTGRREGDVVQNTVGGQPDSGLGLEQAGEQSLEAMLTDETWVREIFGFNLPGYGAPFGDFT